MEDSINISRLYSSINDIYDNIRFLTNINRNILNRSHTLNYYDHYSYNLLLENIRLRTDVDTLYYEEYLNSINPYRYRNQYTQTNYDSYPYYTQRAERAEELTS